MRFFGFLCCAEGAVEVHLNDSHRSPGTPGAHFVCSARILYGWARILYARARILYGRARIFSCFRRRARRHNRPQVIIAPRDIVPQKIYLLTLDFCDLTLNKTYHKKTIYE